MTDEATTPADAGGTPETVIETTSPPIAPSDDGFVDWDNLPDSEPEVAPEGDDLDFAPKPEAKEPTEAEKAEAAKTEEVKAKDDEAKKRLSGAQRAKLKQQTLQDQNADLQRQIDELRAGKTPALAASEDKPPTEEDFNGDFFAYQRALGAFEAAKATRAELAKANADIEARRTASEKSESERKATQQRQEAMSAHMERVEKARAAIADYDKSMEAMKDVNVQDSTINAIVGSDKSELVAYHFANNPSALEAFDAMTPIEQARTIGRLEATLKMPEPKKATSAPAPLTKPKGATTPPDQSAILSNWLKSKYG